MVQLRLIDATDSPNVQDWTATTAVRAKEVRVQGGVLYRRKADGTTRSTFDATELGLWDALGGVGNSYTDEQAQDAVAAMFGAGSNVGITFTYDDAGNRESAVVTATGGAANTIAFTPSGGLSANNVGAALVELDAEKETTAHASATYQPKPTTGTASATTFLRGDGTWAVPAGGGGTGTLTDNGDGTLTISAGSTSTDNGDGTLTL